MFVIYFSCLFGFLFDTYPLQPVKLSDTPSANAGVKPFGDWQFPHQPANDEANELLGVKDEASDPETWPMSWHLEKRKELYRPSCLVSIVGTG